MSENLRIALKNQRKLILIFSLTILFPALLLSFFGIRAIRNERFRRIEQVVNEHRRALDYIEGMIQSRLDELDSVLRGMASRPALRERDHESSRGSILSLVEGNSLIEQMLIVYGDGYFLPQFPGIRDGLPDRLPPPLSLEMEKIRKQAEEFEYEHDNPKKALSSYQEILDLSADRDTEAQVLNDMARCYIKLKDTKRAHAMYSRISREYPECTTRTGIPLALISAMQRAELYSTQNQITDALEHVLALYRSILNEPWNLSESQFKSYTVMAGELADEILASGRGGRLDENQLEDLGNLRKAYRVRAKQWAVASELNSEAIPKIREHLIRSPGYDTASIRLANDVSKTPCLISSVKIPDESRTAAAGILAVKIDIEHLINSTVHDAVRRIRNSQSGAEMNVVITSSAGDTLYGREDPAMPIRTLREGFENKFPPWQIDMFRASIGNLSLSELSRNFYFWMILILIVILASGSILIGKTFASELGILRIKSDFVSSVSHELKTPLTSIKTLIERLQAGRITNPSKMAEYFSMIALATNKLIRQVGNILDFSKLDEGRSTYHFVETVVPDFISRVVEGFRREILSGEDWIKTEIQSAIPPLRIDREAVTMALYNLLDNAVKFSGTECDISLCVSQRQGSVVIDVTDRGIGIPPENIDRIFEKFFQGKNAEGPMKRGTGLGLALVKHIAEDHGGGISVKSEMGKGCTFSLSLPIKKESR